MSCRMGSCVMRMKPLPGVREALETARSRVANHHVLQVHLDEDSRDRA